MLVVNREGFMGRRTLTVVPDVEDGAGLRRWLGLHG